MTGDASSGAGRRADHRSGRYILAQGGPEPYHAFHPRPLPPDPSLVVDADMQDLLDRANQALGRLDGVTQLLPDPDLVIYSFVRKEAVLSSQIEGTQSSLSDLLLFEQDASASVPDDVEESSNYIAAMNHGLRMLETLPISLRVIRGVHHTLLQSGRGADKSPGEFRRSQNWIGGTRPGNARFVPPPPHEVPTAMGDLKKFLHDEPVRTPILIKAALAHAQFETIHPFLDGNGRVGRLLVTLLLCERRVLSEPLLYLSLFLKENRDTYYDLLQRVRTDGAWEDWVRFFLEGVLTVAEQAKETIRRLVRTFDEDRARIGSLGRAAGNTLAVYDVAIRAVVFTPRSVEARLSGDMSAPTMYRCLRDLEGLGIIAEITGRSRSRVYAHVEYLTLLDAGPRP